MGNRRSKKSGIYIYWRNANAYSNKLDSKAQIEAKVRKNAPPGTTAAGMRSGWHASGSDRQSHATVDYTVNGDVETRHVYP
jgi:hypothetical protein